ncbi:MAG TPA: class I SAM-dependent methyltransferase [Pirellulales bacterium]
MTQPFDLPRDAGLPRDASRRPDWRLPPGVTRGLWDYAHAEFIATGYDATLTDDGLCEVDAEEVFACTPQSGVVLDLGCGTGRLAVPLAKRGLHVVGVDLSLPMLGELSKKADAAMAVVDRVQANLVELDGFRDSIADLVLCLYSTLGMIRGREARRRALAHMQRVLKPGAKLVLHVHNRGSLWWGQQGRHNMVRRIPAVLAQREEWGDVVSECRGVAQFFLHFFTHAELRADLASAGLKLVRSVPVSATPVRRLSKSWFWPAYRAAGWVIVCEK